MFSKIPKKVPVVMQLEALECGAACLGMILGYYKRWITLQQLRSDCGVSRDGISIKNMILAAKKHGLDAKVYNYDLDTIKKRNFYPCIIQLGSNYFVVLKGFYKNNAFLNDPSKGEIKISVHKLEQSFMGTVIYLKPKKNFQPHLKRQNTFDFAKKRLKGTGVAIAFTLIVSVVLALTNVISPAFSRIFLDKLITHQAPTWVVPFLIMLLVFNLVQILIKAIQAIFQLRINGKMSVVSNTTFMWKLLHLPLEFFSQTMAGDLQSRKSINATIANTLITVIAPLLLNLALTIFYLAVMIQFSLILTIIGLSALAINAIVSRYISKKRINITRVTMRDVANLSSTTVSGINMMETIKASGAEHGFFSKWSGYQALVNTQNVKLLKTNAYLGMVPSLINTLANSFVTIIGVYLAMNGEFTTGMIMQFQGYLQMFFAPTQSLISAGQTFQEMRTQIERIEDVMDYPSEYVFAPVESINNTTQTKLTGQIELNNITFGYSKLSNPFIKNFNLTIKPGKSIAIVGKTGCGKSTISKLISGLYQPWEGEILFDGKPLSQIEKRVFKSSLAVVDQDIIIFQDSINNNIKMWDESVLNTDVVVAAMDSKIHDDIMLLPDNYDYKLIEDGSNLSGGQRQRIEIARALAKNPSIVIMDEATSALDSKTEYDVVKSIENRNITSIIIAHRLSTIRSCDQIIVMDNGKIVDCGIHKELFERCKIYRDLVEM